MTSKEIKNILDLHLKWLQGINGGSRADLSGANLSGANLSGANLSGANLSGADLSGANLSGANLSGADLSGANLSGANLSGANLSGANLSGADLSGANLSGANLSGADLSGANLSGANLSGANLSRANLSGADLSGADLNYANLSNANLSGADLNCADLNCANLKGANLNCANLSGAKNLLCSIAWLESTFEFNKKGIIIYKAFANEKSSTNYSIPKYWAIKENSIIEEVCNMLPTLDCACGINFAILEWVKSNHADCDIWECLIEYKWMAGICVPYNTNGKARCSKMRLIKKVVKLN